MPKGRLSENNVQAAAIEWLQQYYQDQDAVCVTASRREKKVKGPKKFWGRVDGLIAMQITDGTVFVAAMEAKSSKTLSNIRFQYDNSKWVLHGIIVGLACALLALGIGLMFDGWFWHWVLPLITFVAAAVVFMFAAMENSRYKDIKVVGQIRRYPANEQWIAISTDAFNLLKKDFQQELRDDCSRNGIGLIRVSPGKKITRIADPVSKPTPGSIESYLDYYVCGQEMADEIGTNAPNASTEIQ